MGMPGVTVWAYLLVVSAFVGCISLVCSLGGLVGAGCWSDVVSVKWFAIDVVHCNGCGLWWSWRGEVVGYGVTAELAMGWWGWWVCRCVFDLIWWVGVWWLMSVGWVLWVLWWGVLGRFCGWWVLGWWGSRWWGSRWWGCLVGWAVFLVWCFTNVWASAVVGVLLFMCTNILAYQLCNLQCPILLVGHCFDLDTYSIPTSYSNWLLSCLTPHVLSWCTPLLLIWWGVLGCVGWFIYVGRDFDYGCLLLYRCLLLSGGMERVFGWGVRGVVL